MNRYSRHIILSEVGQKGQEKLSASKVLVIGAGGLGCPVLQYLTAAGIGFLGIMDHDLVSISNLQRQVLYGSSTIGKNKAEVAKQRLQDLNNSIKINAYPEKLTHKNAIELFQQYDIIVDGTDNFATRYLINDASVITNKPLVYGAIHKFEGQVSVFNYQNGPSYRCVFSTPPEANEIPNCSEVGVLGVLPGIIGSIQATEVIKIILGLGSILSGKLFYYNALTAESTLLMVNRSENEIKKVLENRKNFEDSPDEFYCEKPCTDNSCDEVSLQEVLKMKNVQFIDVREPQEQPIIEYSQVTAIPLSVFEKNIDKIDPEKIKIIFCQIGVRSIKAVSILKKHHVRNSYSLKEGAAELASYLALKNKN